MGATARRIARIHGAGVRVGAVERGTAAHSATARVVCGARVVVVARCPVRRVVHLTGALAIAGVGVVAGPAGRAAGGALGNNRIKAKPSERLAESFVALVGRRADDRIRADASASLTSVPLSAAITVIAATSIRRVRASGTQIRFTVRRASTLVATTARVRSGGRVFTVHVPVALVQGAYTRKSTIRRRVRRRWTVCPLRGKNRTTVRLI